VSIGSRRAAPGNFAEPYVGRLAHAAVFAGALSMRELNRIATAEG
jgi:hypothetical protein